MATSARRLREIQQRQAFILDVARGMLIESGYLGLNMDRIAEATEYSKGTIYQHFSCKEEVMIALCIQNLQRQAELFERAATFQGRSRERMAAVAEAFDVFVRLYPHHFQASQIIHSVSIRDKTSEERQLQLQRYGDRLTGVMTGIIRDAMAQGDLSLPPWSSPEKLTFGLWSMAFGAYLLIAGDKPHEALGLENPREILYGNYNALLDGMGWQPLSSAWEYEQTYQRVRKEVFADEYRQLRPR